MFFCCSLKMRFWACGFLLNTHLERGFEISLVFTVFAVSIFPEPTERWFSMKTKITLKLISLVKNQTWDYLTFRPCCRFWAPPWRWLDVVRPSCTERSATRLPHTLRSTSFGNDCLRIERRVGNRLTLSSLWSQHSADQRSCEQNHVLQFTETRLQPQCQPTKHFKEFTHVDSSNPPNLKTKILHFSE